MSTVNWKASVGDKGGAGSQYPMQGYVDDFKYCYRVLTPTGKFGVLAPCWRDRPKKPMHFGFQQPVRINNDDWKVYFVLTSLETQITITHIKLDIH